MKTKDAIVINWPGEIVRLFVINGLLMTLCISQTRGNDV